MKKNAFNQAALVLLCLSAVTLTACEGTKKQLGLVKQSPDEFAVLQRAPLELPPDYSLRPPRPGAPRPQEQNIETKPRRVVFGNESQTQTAPDNAENALLQRAGSSIAQPGIRDIVDQESVTPVEEDKPVSERLFGVMGLGDDSPKDSVLDAEAEADRLRQNRDAGLPVTEGDTPTADQ